MKKAVCLGAFALAILVAGGATAAQNASQAKEGAQKPAPSTSKPASQSAPEAGVAPPPDYVIGPEDVLEVIFWREKDISGEVMVRPDGMVSLPLLNDMQAAGLTPEAFREKLVEAASRFVESPSAAVIVKQINSRKVYITGEVAKAGPYPLIGPLSVMQLLSVAGGLNEYADKKNILIIRTVNGKVERLRFNYQDVARGRQQDMMLKPGDTVIVP